MTCVIPSQSYNLSLFPMPVIQCIIAQWRHISSESAVQNVVQNAVATVSNTFATIELLLPNVMPN